MIRWTVESEFKVARSFSSYAECSQYLVAEYYGRSREEWLDRPDTRLVVLHACSGFLFRGECGRFPHTKPDAARPETWTVTNNSGERVRLSAVDRYLFQHLSNALIKKLIGPAYELSPLEALAVQQHYGLPTTMIDCTSNPDFAMTFATYDRPYEGRLYEKVGRICVIPTGAFRKGLSVAELVQHRWAARAQRQEAFGVIALGSKVSADLKSKIAIQQWGVRWYEFEMTQQDREQAEERYRSLVETSDDPTAGILRHEIIEYVERYGKLPHNLASFVIQRIPMVPRAGRVISEQNGLIRHVPPSEVGELDEERERTQTERYISSVYPDKSADRSYWMRLERGKLLVDPRTWHPTSLA